MSKALADYTINELWDEIKRRFITSTDNPDKCNINVLIVTNGCCGAYKFFYNDDRQICVGLKPDETTLPLEEAKHLIDKHIPNSIEKPELEELLFNQNKSILEYLSIPLDKIKFNVRFVLEDYVPIVPDVY